MRDQRIYFHNEELPWISEAMVGGFSRPNGGCAPHWHPEWQIGTVTRGDGWVRIRGQKHQTPVGTVFVIPPRVSHSNDTYAQGCDYRTMFVEESVIQNAVGIQDYCECQQYYQLNPILATQSFLKRFVRFHHSLHQIDDLTYLEQQMIELLEDLSFKFLRNRDHSSGKLIHPAINQAREILWEETERRVSLQNLSVRCGMSLFELSRQFKTTFGLPPHAWATQARIALAKKKLRSGLPPATVAADLGFVDQAHLSRVFRKIVELPPGKYARCFRKNVQEWNSTLH